jgi:hypothetical protein
MTLFFRLLLLLLLVSAGTDAQQILRPGFEAAEYQDVLALNSGLYDSLQRATGRPVLYQKTITSRVTGLDNRWWLFQRSDTPIAVIAIRGTIATGRSWMANLYGVQEPATGTLFLNDSTRIDYQLAQSPEAAIHAGWLIAVTSMADDIERKIRELHDKGIRHIILSGHSQGGAITYLLRSYLFYRTKSGALPADIVYKTYCSAAPKPGNLPFAYDFEYINRGGWAFNVVNAADWVPETPISLQQLQDINPLNPLNDLDIALSRQKWPVRVYARMIHGKLTRKSRKAVGKYQKLMGGKIAAEVKKSLPQLKLPEATPGLNYMRAGTAIVLMPDSAYFKTFPQTGANGRGVWTHHGFEAYLYLLRKDYMQ